ncbi:MAG: DnaA/Hda family protein [Peptococcaceae bacterium]|nr:DnaA/Hda family protein [Peptococcaceae bacterium]
MRQQDFFVSPCNSRAYQVVTKLDMDTIPPVTLIYGTQGSGKTTLLSLLQTELTKRGQRFICVDALDFSSRYAFAAQKKNLPAFRQNMRSVSLFLCDNLERLCGREKSLEELMYTCEGIWVKGGHVIATLNTERLTLHEFGPRLSSRLCLGVAAHIAKPSFEEVSAFLDWRRDKETERELDADHFRGWHFGQIVRYLDRGDGFRRGVRTGVSSHGTGVKGSGAAEWIWGNLQEIAERMMEISRRCFHVDEDELRGPFRGAKIVRLRTIQYYILHAQGYTQREIADHYRQGRESVARGCARMKANWVEYEQDYKFFLSELRGPLL